MKTLIPLAILCLLNMFCYAQKSKLKTKLNRGDFYYKEGYQAYKEHKIDSALFYYQKSLAVMPTALVYEAIGNIYRIYKFEERFKSLNYFDKAIELSGKNNRLKSDCLYERASIKIDARDYNGALIDCNSGLSLNPKEKTGLYSLKGEAEYYLESYIEAIKDCDISISTSNATFWEPYCFRGLSELKLSQNDKGCEDLQMSKSILGENSGFVDQFIKKYCQQ